MLKPGSGSKSDSWEFYHLVIFLSEALLYGLVSTTIYMEALGWIETTWKELFSFTRCNVLIDWRRKWQFTPVFLSGEFHGQKTLMGYSPWGHDLSVLHMTDYFSDHRLYLGSILKAFITKFIKTSFSINKNYVWCLLPKQT